MDLYFSHRRFFQTGFHVPCSKTSQDDSSCGRFKELYRAKTTVRKGSILPDRTTIEYVGAEDLEKHYVVATIEWRWPSRVSSVIEIDGNRLPLKEFMKREARMQFQSTGTNLMIGDEQFTWRSSVCRPTQLFNSQSQPIARLTPRIRRFEPLWRDLVVQPGCLHILNQEIATDAYMRDFVVASFFVYRACRDLHLLFTPWWKEKQADFSGLRFKTLKRVEDGSPP